MRSEGNMQIKIGSVSEGTKYVVACEVADTPETRWLGLRGRFSLPEDDGMVFFFESAQYVEMTMRGVNYPIDMIFIGPDSSVISVAQSVAPGTPTVVCDGVAAVVEVAAGICERYGIGVGDGVAKKVH